MLCVEDGRTLICYAGSASEASIGSKPIGSELKVFICILCGKSQDSVDLEEHLLFSQFRPELAQSDDNPRLFEHIVSSRIMAEARQ
jgi:hypothetical protein